MKSWLLGISILLTASLTHAGERPWGGVHRAQFLSSLKSASHYPSIELDAELITQLRSAESQYPIQVPALREWQHSDALRSPELQPFDVRAAGSETLVLVNGEQQSVDSRSSKTFYRLTHTELDMVLSVDLVDQSIRGWARDDGQRFAVEVTNDRIQLAPIAAAPEAERMCELVQGQFADIDHSALSRPTSLPSLGNAVANTSHMYEAIVAVDTDNEWLWEKFNNNATAAEAWVDDAFAAMNVFFERDLDLRMLRGDLILRIDTTPAGNPDFNADPYSELGDVLGEFGSHWLDTADLRNRAGAFVSLLSGRGFSAQNPIISRNSFSGIAWVDAYCQRTRRFGNFGSFNVNRIGANLGVGFVSGGWGHELGHNLGSSHTHCERLAPGNNFVDECTADEAGRGCFGGSPSCPAGGSGTIMSYCNPGLYRGPGSCSARDEFHPLIIDKLTNIIQSEAPSCILPAGSQGETPLFSDSFEL